MDGAGLPVRLRRQLHPGQSGLHRDDAHRRANANERAGDASEHLRALQPTDSFLQSSWVRWSVDLFNIHSQKTATRVYTNIPTMSTGARGRTTWKPISATTR